MSNQIAQLSALGTSTWLDDLSRDRINSGNLAKLIDSKNIVGVTTNPAIFAGAMGGESDAYDEQIAQLKQRGAAADEAVFAMAIDDVAAACDVFAPVHRATAGVDGRVSIEVDPRYAEDAAATVSQAKQLWEAVGRDNVMIKIPATKQSLPAITEALANGISVNVTLIFSVERYREVVDVYLEGIRRAHDAGLDVSKIFSVASFFVSRVDVEIDRRLEAIGSEEALALRGKAGVANAQQAYAAFSELFSRAKAMGDLPRGANVQRPLWASTGVKNPDYPATLYVSELAGPDTVNTMPESTIDAVLAADDLHGKTLVSNDSAKVMQQLRAVGVDLDDVFDVLEREGVEKFVDSWQQLLDTIEQRL